jgi:hypothetical protein
MSDEIEVLNALKAEQRNRRDHKAVINADVLKASKLPFIEQSKNVFRSDLRAGVVMYYASSDKWQHRGKVYQGTIEELITWIRNKRMQG